MEPRNNKEKVEFEVDPRDVYKGAEILEFLMDASPPGTVPDPTVLGSIMGLVNEQ